MYEIRLARQSGGKAGKGHNKTSTIQVLYHSVIVKQFRFTMGDAESILNAKAKAKDYVEKGKMALTRKESTSAD